MEWPFWATVVCLAVRVVYIASLLYSPCMMPLAAMAGSHYNTDAHERISSLSGYA